MNTAIREWREFPTTQTIVHRCNGGGITRGNPVVLTAHPSRPDACTVVRSDWDGPVIEARAACGCVRWRGVYDATIDDRLRMLVLVSNRDETLPRP